MCAFALASCGGSSDHSSPNTTAQSPTTPTASAPTTVTVPTVTTPSRTTTAPTVETDTIPAPKPPPQNPKHACGNVAGNFIKNIQTVAVPCSAARAVAQQWLAQVQKGSNPAQPISVSGFTCAARFRGELAAVLCERSGARIVFSAQP
jgi:hypothetical protein